MKTTHTLSDLAELHTAVVFRDQAPQEHPEGNVRALAIRDVVSSTPVNWSELPRVVVAAKYLANCLQEGDVVIPSRGDYYRAWLFTGADLPVLPVGQLNVIRPAATLDAGYLVWFLNLPTTGAKLKQMLTGTSIKALTKTALQTLEVDLLNMGGQRRIAEIAELAGRIAAIRHRLTELDVIEVTQMAGLFSHLGGDDA
ncbi:restriction endonuclease subunit S [Acidovorax sp. SUPP2522]|uniref:restriction endonuclease subunit S n=1 Tax=unclassified Acidovorax TaxID=2684926 RepID=UPI00234BC7F6|nr:MULTISPECIES: restriction endonuclease subunit S [unclassified Acidovorax]WCM97919.1 restriction endonuclease subunit S [Acidovorax sp. GBBC 1281]GKT16399.1 restriction endonuclease subunit S [Acidovorax sp. SUPP2522]